MNFISRHIGPDLAQQQEMLNSLGFTNLEDFIQATVPANLFSNTGTLGVDPLDEFKALEKLSTIAAKNKLYKNYIGMGYAETIVPSVIKRNVLENPGWYTAYTPYQAEISQGRLEALLNYQQMLMDLTGFALANASLLDEATAAAESMLMSMRINHTGGNQYFVNQGILPQSLAVIKTRARYAGIEVVVGDITALDSSQYFGVFIQNPNVIGEIKDYTQIINCLKAINPNLIVTMACDILSLVLFKSPQQQGADIAIGTTQRFGVPLGFGGPAAAYLATHDTYKRTMPGRIIGLSLDSRGKKALRMSLQTREQHIRREKATSNICTAQVLLANMAGFYAIYHGRQGLTDIATKIHNLSLVLANTLLKYGFTLANQQYLFDTVAVIGPELDQIYARLLANGYAVGQYQGQLLIA
ncbi:MAG: glycine dehydrogenase, partial [Burkholderiales bacterium]